MAKYLLLGILIYCNTIKGQDTINQIYIDHITHMPTYKLNDYKDLTKKLISIAKSDREKAELIFYWISNNVEYDFWRAKYIYAFHGTKSPLEILTSKKGVCSDYSSLFKLMCDEASLKCYIISGYAIHEDHNKSFLQEVNHDWNSVYLEGKWYLIDATWGAGYSDEEDVYHKRFNLEYLFPNPIEFVKRHLPENPMWQLVDYPVSGNDFFSLNFEYKKNIYYNFNDSIIKYENLITNEEKRIMCLENHYYVYGFGKEKLINGYLINANKVFSEYSPIYNPDEEAIKWLEKAAQEKNDYNILGDGYKEYAMRITYPYFRKINCENLHKSLILIDKAIFCYTKMENQNKISECDSIKKEFENMINEKCKTN